MEEGYLVGEYQTPTSDNSRWKAIAEARYSADMEGALPYLHNVTFAL